MGAMQLDLTLIIIGLGFALIFEGLPYFAAPRRMRHVLLFLASRPDQALRMLGLAAMLGGLLLVWMGQNV